MKKNILILLFIFSTISSPKMYCMANNGQANNHQSIIVQQNSNNDEADGALQFNRIMISFSRPIDTQSPEAGNN